MTIHTASRTALALGVLLLGGLAAGSFAADAPKAASNSKEPTRTVLLRSDLDIPGREAVMVAVEVPPGVAEGLHTHPAELFSFVEQGELTVELEGQPTRVYRAGEVLHIPAGKVHQGINRGAVTAKLSAVFIAQKGQPLTVAKP